MFKEFIDVTDFNCKICVESAHGYTIKIPVDHFQRERKTRDIAVCMHDVGYKLLLVVAVLFFCGTSNFEIIRFKCVTTIVKNGMRKIMYLVG